MRSGTLLESLWWVQHVWAICFALSSLVLIVGASRTLADLRRDRDQASARARIDPLTQALSWAAPSTRC